MVDFWEFVFIFTTDACRAMCRLDFGEWWPILAASEVARGRQAVFLSMKQILSKLFNRGENPENRADLGHLTRLIRRYTVEQQQVPKELADLVELKYLSVLPVA